MPIWLAYILAPALLFAFTEQVITTWASHIVVAAHCERYNRRGMIERLETPA